MNNSLWPLLASSKEWLLRLRWVITGLFVPVLGALWAKVQFGYPLHIPSQSLLGNSSLHPSPSFSASDSSCERNCNRIQLHYNYINSVPSLFHSNKEILNEYLMRNKELNMGLCIQGCGRSDVLYVLKGSERSVGEVSGPVEDAHSLLSNGLVTIFSHCSQMCISVHICW